MKELPLSHEELQLFKRRSFILKSTLAVPLSWLGWRLWNLQVFQGDKFKGLSKGNRIRVRPMEAPRGIIFDSDMDILSKNIPSFNLILVKEDCPNINEIIIRVAETLAISREKLFYALESSKKTAKFKPILLYEDLTWHQMSIINAYNERFPGIYIDTGSRRYYPQGNKLAHVLGYMGMISEAQLKKLPEERLLSGRVVGRYGIEKVFNNYLIGRDGGEQIEVNHIGRKIKLMRSIEPWPGKDLKLTIDGRLQQYIEKIFTKRKGSVVAMNPNNGKVLAMLSNPSFDPNEFSQGLDNQRWQELSNSPDNILWNKTIQGLYSPGSTFKMVVAVAGLELGLIDKDFTFNCQGYFRYNRRLQMHCWKRSGHGDMNVVQALENSCNIFFYKLALEIGVDRIHQYALRMGLGKQTGINLPNEKSGLIPNKQWKQKRYNEIWYPGETLPVAIGQGFITVTPLQLVNYVNIFANGGKLVKPIIVEEIIQRRSQDNEGKTTSTGSHIISSPTVTPLGFKKETIQLIQKGMTLVVNGKNGTGKGAYTSKFNIAGKTGTTQLISNKTKWRLLKKNKDLDEELFNHAWFVAYAPVENPQISLAVLLEHGRNSKYASPYVKDILEYYFSEISPLTPTIDDRFIKTLSS